MMLSQVEAARIMYAANKWAAACENLGAAKCTVLLPKDELAASRAEQAFADLIATLVEPEP